MAIETQNIVTKYIIESDTRALRDMGTEVKTIGQTIRSSVQQTATDFRRFDEEVKKVRGTINDTFASLLKGNTESTRSFDEVSNTLDSQISILKNLENSLASVAKFRDGVLINREEVKKASDEIESQRGIVASLRSELNSMSRAVAEVSSAEQQLQRNTNNINSEIARRTNLLGQLERSFVNVAKVRNGVIINPVEVQMATDEIEEQEEIVKRLEQSLVDIQNVKDGAILDQAALDNTTKELETQSKTLSDLRVAFESVAVVKDGVIINQGEINAASKEIDEQRETIAALKNELVEAEAEFRRVTGAQNEAARSTKVYSEFTNDTGQSLDDLSNSLADQVVVLKELENSFVSIARFNDGVLTNPEEVAKASEAIKFQRDIVRGLEQDIVEAATAINEITESEEELEQQTNKVSKSTSEANKETTLFGRAIKAIISGGILATFANELRQISPIADGIESSISGLRAGLNSFFNSGSFFDAGVAASIAVAGTRELQRLRREEVDLRVEIARSSKLISDQDSILTSSLSTIQQRSDALNRISEISISNARREISVLEEREAAFVLAFGEQLQNNDAEAIEGLGEIRLRIADLRNTISEIPANLQQSLRDLFGVTDVERATNSLQDYQNRLSQVIGLISSGGNQADIDRVLGGETLDSLQANIRLTARELEQAQFEENLRNATDALEENQIVINKFSVDLRRAIQQGGLDLEENDAIINRIINAQLELEDITLRFNRSIASNPIQEATADIALFETQIERLVGSDNIQLVQRFAEQLERLRAVQRVQSDESNPFIDLEQQLLSARQALFDEGLTDILDFNQRREEIELDSRIATLRRQQSFEADENSKRYQELELEITEFENRRNAIDDIFTQLRFQRDLGEFEKNVELAEQLTEVINANELARFDFAIELQERRVAEALRIAEDGNSKQLQLEEERLDKLLEEREQAADRQAVINKAFTQAQIIINTAETISNIQLAAAKTAAITGPTAPVVVPIVLAVLSGLIASAGNLFQPPALYEGTDYSVAETLGRTGVRDGHFVRIDDEERVLKPSLNRKVKGMSSDELVENALKGQHVTDFQVPLSQSILITQPYRMPKEVLNGSVERTLNNQANSELLAENRKLRKGVEKMVKKQDQMITAFATLGIEFNVDEKGISAAVKRQQRKEKRRNKRLG